MKINYRQRLYLYCFIILLLYTGILIALSLNKDEKIKNECLKLQQVIYAEIVENYMDTHQLTKQNINELTKIVSIFPADIRITILNHDGFIIYDNIKPSAINEDSKKFNAEIKRALLTGEGWNTRQCIALEGESLYYAKTNDNNIVRVGSPCSSFYSSIETDYTYIILAIIFFILTVIALTMIYRNYVKSIKNLKKFIISFFNNKTSPKQAPHTDDELGEIQKLIVKLYNQVETNKKDTALEREKLLDHFHYSEEGISFFSQDRENLYTNTHFVQYLSILLNEPTFDVKHIFDSPIFNEVVYFLNNEKNKNTFNCKIEGNGRYFYVHAIIFEDKSFEIIIRDITEAEKNNFDRAEMTNNIAHELRTPVTSIRGYLETIINSQNISLDRMKEFINKAYIQTNRLTEIIQDVILLSKPKNLSKDFNKEEINTRELLDELIEIDVKEAIEQGKVKVIIDVEEDVIIKGNRSLLGSIFRNLGNNALKYAGENITITVKKYMEDEDFYYFSFADNGIGIEEKYLARIFERFYRITEGRTRDKGGSGLGLSIVKDAVEFHGGEIFAKNKPEGGLEFLFTIKKV